MIEQLTEETLPQRKGFRNSRTYKWIGDGIANNLFSLLYGLNEYFVAGMTWPQVGRARATAAVGNMLTGGLYGEWQEGVTRRLGVTDSSHWSKKYGADVLSFATGQSPLYILYLVGSTAGWDSIKALYEGNMEQLVDAWKNIDWAGIGKGTAFLTMIAPVAASPQRWVYDKVRKLFGLEKIIAENKK